MLHVHLFGHLRLFEDERALRFAALPRTLSLFAYLLLRRGEALPREALAFTLWPDVPEAEARANLRRHLHDLKRALPSNPPGAPYVVADTRTLQWNPTSLAWLDVAEFEGSCADAGRYAEAVAVYTGDLLPDLYEDWVAPDRERLRQLYLTTLARLLDQHRTRQDYLQAIVYAQQILACEPLREDVARDLIALRAAAGDRSGALQEYRSFVQRLKDDLGADPMADTTALYQGLLREGPTIHPAAAIVEPAPPAAASTPPVRTNRWPAPVTRLIGRETELVEITRLLTSPESGVRLVTLTGAGGAGKTRLSLELLAHFRADPHDLFADGLYFVPLATITDSALLTAAIGEALGLGAASIGQLQDYLQTRRLLLVLDNFEQLTEAASVLAQLLEAAPGLRLVVTSRAVLQLYGEHEVSLPALALPDLAHLPPPQALQDYAAVALFVERVRAFQSAFSLTPENADAVAEICVRLDGLPLALELAAARIRLFSPPGLLERLKSSLEALARPGPGGAPHQQTLRATMDWSYNLLSPNEQRVFVRLAVFGGSWSLAATEAVVDEPEVLDALSSLADKSMVRRLAADDSAEDPRFRLLWTIREYARERLKASEERETWRERHARYYLALAEQAHAGLSGAGQAEALRQLETEHDNLRAGLGWAVACGATEVALRLAAALGRFWDMRGYSAEGLRWMQSVLVMPGAVPPTLRASALLAAGLMAARQGDQQTAEVHYREGLELYEAAGDPAGQARALNSLGASLQSLGRAGEARPLFERSLALFRLQRDAAGEADALNGLARLAYYSGDLAGARQLFEQSLALRRERGDARAIASSLNNLGVVDLALGDYASARARHAENLTVRRGLGLKPGIAQSLHNLGTVLALLHETAAARECYQASLALHWELGAKGGIAEDLEGLAWLAAAQGEGDTSARLFGSAAALRAAIKAVIDPSFQAEHDQAVAAMQGQLTLPVFEAAYGAGRDMPLSQAVALAGRFSDAARLS